MTMRLHPRLQQRLMPRGKPASLLALPLYTGPFAGVLAHNPTALLQFQYPELLNGGVYTDTAGTIPVATAGQDTIAAVRCAITGDLIAVQENSLNRPLWMGEDGGASLDGIDDYMVLAEPFRRAGSDPFTMLAGASRNSDSTGALATNTRGFGENVGYQVLGDSTSRLRVRVGNDTLISSASGAWASDAVLRTITLVNGGASSTWAGRVNSVQAVTGTPGTHTLADQNRAILGARNTLDGTAVDVWFHGDVTFLVLFHRATDPTETAAVEAALEKENA